MNNIFENQRWFNEKGSILIWSVMLGFVLTSVFFFFGMRQRANIEVQRDTVEILNTRAYLKSYADYLEQNVDDLGELNNEFDGIQVVLTRQVDEIEGVADVGTTETYQFTGDIFMEWNHCDDSMIGDLIVDGTTYKSVEKTPPCQGYVNAQGPISVSGSFFISTANAPFRYRIMGTDLNDNKWHLELSTKLDYGKKIKVRRVFE